MTRAAQAFSSRQLLSLLLEYPQGVSEHALLKRMAELGWLHLEADTFTDLHKLFHTHFLLFNRLYLLRDELHQQGAHSLTIETLSIRVLPYQPGMDGLQCQDPLRRYYLDLSELERTGVAELEAMLNRFWSGIHAPVISLSERHEALSVLGLEADASYVQAKRAWRQLAMRHHPDRGGDEDVFKRLNAAMELLSASQTNG